MSDASTVSDESAAGDGAAVEDLIDDLDELSAEVNDPETRQLVASALETAADLQPRGFDNVIVGFDRTDASEAFLGAVIFGVPMFVESGTQEVGEFLAAHPIYLVGTHVTALALVLGILYVADFQDVRIQNPLFGIVPRRLVGIFAIAFLTAVLAMTAWGRVDWTRPWLALCTASVAFVPMVIGAAVSDILPGS